MTIKRSARNQSLRFGRCRQFRKWPIMVLFVGSWAEILTAQNANQGSLSEQMQKLSDAIAITQAQLEQSQRQIGEMQKQLKALQQQMVQSGSTESAPSSAGSTSSASATQ